MPATAKSLYMLPFDHRASFETGLFGWSGALSDEQTAQIAASKRLIYAAALEAIATGVPWECAAVLVDEQFGASILADARRRGLATACPVEESGRAEFDFQYGEDFARHIEDRSAAKFALSRLAVSGGFVADNHFLTIPYGFLLDKNTHRTAIV